ncbi:hypothetical protein OBJ93_12060 [Empedobacter falsenii]
MAKCGVKCKIELLAYFIRKSCFAFLLNLPKATAFASLGSELNFHSIQARTSPSRGSLYVIVKKSMKLKFIYFQLFICLFLTSCHGFLNVTGHVVDSENNPIENAEIYLIFKKNDTIKYLGNKVDTKNSDSLITKNDFLGQKYISGLLKTNNEGFFNSKQIYVGCVPKCPKIKLLVKDGNDYVFTEIKNLRNDSLKIQIEKSKR